MKLFKSLLVSALPAIISLLSLPAHAQFKAITEFGDNPGEISASLYLPGANTKSLVVLMHGCIQNGELFAGQSGFLSLAKEKKFALLVPQQNESNNIKRCFNWFSPQDIEKDRGETLSLKNLVLEAKRQSKAEHVYIAGLSAGGAMTSNLLVNYPDLFDAGAVIAGIPFPCADSLVKAISCMRTGPAQSKQELIEQVRKLSKGNIRWPRLSIWTGTEDKVVNPTNADLLAKQWAGLLQLENPVTINQQGVEILQWQGKQNSPLVELVKIANMGHGMPVRPDLANGGEERPYLLKAQMSAAINIVDYWQVK